MESSSSLLINRFFSRSTFRNPGEIGQNKAYTATIRRYVLDADSKTNKECISEVYEYLRKNYQNEYFYKNTLLNKLLLGIHSLRTTSALAELPVEGSKADFILINGKAVVYEIKTDLDNLERLDGQICDYYKAFSRVTVVTSEGNYPDVEKRLINTPTGICVLTNRGTLSLRKNPEEYCAALSQKTMFKILRKNEYEEIVKTVYKMLPCVSQFEYYRACESLFEMLPVQEAYSLFLQQLKARTRIEIHEYSKVPYELKYLVYFLRYKDRDYATLNDFLNA